MPFKNKICGIYKITSPNKKIYIGQSINIFQRFSIYRGFHCKGQTKLLRSLKKYGWEKHKFEIIEQCKIEELNQKEIYYIELYQSYNSNYGMNLKEGGGKSGKLSDETRKKLSEFQKSRKQPIRTKEWLQHMSESRIGNIPWNKEKSMSIETKIKMKISNKRSLATRKKIGESRIGKPNCNSKKVINIETNEIYYSITDAAKKNNIPLSTLCKNIKIINKTKFKYYAEDKNIIS